MTGSSGVGYTLLDTAGAIVSPRTTVGVYQVASGAYAVNVTFPDRFHGQILWDCPATGSLSTSFAVESQNVEANDPRISDTWQMVNNVTGTIASLYDAAYGRWRIDKATNRMIFYKADNVTVVATYNLFDDTGTPVFDGVFERQKV